MVNQAKKSTKVKANFIKKTNDVNDTECGGLDAEIKNIFDNLRRVGDPQVYSLNEVLLKAIATEKELIKAKVKTSNEKLSYGKFKDYVRTYIWQIFKVWEIKFQQLQFQEFMTVLLLSLGIVCIMSMLPSSVQANSKEKQYYFESLMLPSVQANSETIPSKPSPSQK